MTGPRANATGTELKRHGRSKVEVVQAYGKRIVQIDFNGCGPEQFGSVLAEAERVIRQEPTSARALTLVGDTHFAPEAVEELTRFAARVRSMLEASAVVGLTGVKHFIFGGIREYYRAPVGIFEDAEQAKQWLALQAGWTSRGAENTQSH